MRGARSPAQRATGSRADRYLLLRRVQAVSFEGKFADPRWVNGTWDLAQFNGANGETDWDAVIDAEVRPWSQYARPDALVGSLLFFGISAKLHTTQRLNAALRRQIVRRRRLEIAPEPSELEDEVKVRAALRPCFGSVITL